MDININENLTFIETVGFAVLNLVSCLSTQLRLTDLHNLDWIHILL